MAEKETKEKPPEGSDIRYKYIGFDVYGSKVKEFFRSEEEKKHFEEEVAKYGKEHSSSLRSGTAVRANLLSTVDRIVLTLSSLGLIVGSFLPWFSISSIYGELKMVGILVYSSTSGLMELLSRFSATLPILAYVFSGLAVLSIVFGILSLLMLYLPSKNMEKRMARLKHTLGWQYLPITIWVALLIFLIVGIDIPFGEDLSDIYAIRGLSSQFNIVTFWVFAQPALWLTIGSFVINAIKSNDL